MRSILTLVLLCTACRDKESAVVNTENSPPQADAGTDQNLSADQEIRLDGGGSFDPDGDPLSYEWTFSRVPEGSSLADDANAFSHNNMATAITTFVPDTMGTYIISLQVTDVKGSQSAPDSVIISVTEGALPIAHAGDDQQITEGESVVLDGSTSYDPLGRTLSYEWSVASAPPGSVAAVQSATNIAASFTPDVAGSYLVSLVVNSGVNVSTPDVMVVKVTSANPQGPQAVAAASANASLEDCTHIPLNGNGSSDPNGDSLSYFWSLQEKPSSSNSSNTSFSDRTLESPTFYADVAGDYILSLAVNDGTEWSSPDLITLTVAERLANSAPAVNAGNSLTVNAGDAECELSGYSYSCDSCENVVLSLGDGASVNDPDGDVYTTSWSVLSGDADISDESAISTTITLKGAEPEEPNVCASTVYEVQLTATDCPGISSSDIVHFTVECCGIEAVTQ